jgi:hypothetical protein
MIWYIIAIVLMGLGVGLYFGYKSQGEKLFQIKAAQTYLVSDLMQEAKDVEEGLGEKGSFNKLAEVKGKIQCDNPLTSELARKSCVHYSMSITRKWEETYWDTDSEGRRTQKTRQGSDTVAHNERSVPFYVQDSSGKIKINPEGAEMIREKVYSDFKSGEQGGSRISIGSFSMTLPSVASTSGRRTIGYEYEESIIPVNRDIYILGEAADSSGEVQLQKPSDAKKKFIISVKSEEELKRSIQGTMTGMLVGGIISEIAGIVLLILKITNIIQG